MTRLILHDAGWSLYSGDVLLARHSAERPFAAAIRREKQYSADRGSVKVRVTETERTELTALSEADEGGFTLTGGERRLRVDVSETELGMRLAFTGEPGWAYEFTLPAEAGEAVFGGGEQYRQVNLRGEKVPNLVSEHIRASTVIQKALLPRMLYKEKPHGQIGSYAPMPVFVTDRGRMIRFVTDSDGLSDFTGAEFRFTFDACPKALILTRAEGYEALVRALAKELPNRQYLPDWCLEGMILGVQGGTQTVLDKAFAMLDAGAKISAVWCQDWCGENRTAMGKQVGGTGRPTGSSIPA